MRSVPPPAFGGLCRLKPAFQAVSASFMPRGVRPGWNREADGLVNVWVMRTRPGAMGRAGGPGGSRPA